MLYKIYTFEIFHWYINIRC